MKTIVTRQISEELFLIRTIDQHVQYFEALWDVPEGMVYNAYLLKTSEGAVLFDTTKARFTEPFMEALSILVDPAEIKHIVIHHMEPDHSGALPAVLEAAGAQVTVWGHPFAKRLIEGGYGLSPQFQPVKDGNTLEIGGKKLVFYQTPWLHWPETMVTWLPDEKILLSGDIFGSYGIPDGIFDDDEDDLQEYLHLAREYFVSVIGHYKDYVLKSLRKLEEKAIVPEMILSAHGLLWRKEPGKIINKYADWAVGKAKKGKVIVAYSSMYGYVEKAVWVAVEELKRRGFHPEVFRFTDEHRDSVVDILGELPNCEAIIFATATYEAGVFPLMRQLIEEVVHKADYPKPVLLLSIFGWACMAGKQLKPVFESSSLQLVDAVGFKGLLRDEDSAHIIDGVDKLVTAIEGK